LITNKHQNQFSNEEKPELKKILLCKMMINLRNKNWKKSKNRKEKRKKGNQKKNKH